MKTKLCLAAIAASALQTPAFAQDFDAVFEEIERAETAPAEPVAERIANEYVRRILQLDDAGPEINAVIALNPDAARQARDAEAAGRPLAGRTVLVKDNIETRELPTTAGSLALKDNFTGRDAPLIAKLREAGGVVLGKANLSEWANIRDFQSTSGWSAIGGLTRNPHAIDRNTCGSSSGSGAGVAARFAWAAIGTETDGSITCPASINGIVGFKPSVGMVSRTHVVPISHTQDTAGPMTQSVGDAAMLLNAIAGTDPADPATADAAQHITDFTDGLGEASLEGVRIGVLRNQVGSHQGVTALFEQALADLRNAGAVLVDIEFTPSEAMGEAEFAVLLYELREDMATYLASLPGSGGPRSLADLIAFNEVNAEREMRWFGQDIFEMAEGATSREEYEAAKASAKRMAGEEGIDRLLFENRVEFLIAPTTGPAWSTDLVNGDNYSGGIGAGNLAAIAGYPHLTVPMGATETLPVGLSFMSRKWADHEVLKVGAAY
ncbi:amidase [Qipengyuania atrilutea]|uniref:Amidase n=1 Tax=Qipengyuania atrilutea TaxID=2744473 RepID=A0A850H5G2_9SPHN|nr:amidase [Actirhodobacter atriluteus]NVD45402.1 amidase [Actirhodobacter atriluteus]